MKTLSKIPAIFWVFLVLIIGFLVFAVIQGLVFSPSYSSFLVNGRTEKIEFTCQDNNVSNLVFYNASISSFDSTLVEKFNGSVRIMPGTKVSFERPAKLDLLVTFQNNRITPPIKIYNEDQEERTLNTILKDNINYIEILVSITDSLLSQVGNLYFSLDGEAQIGNNIDRPNWGEIATLIIDGELLVIGRSMVINKYIEYEKVKLYPGDLVKFSHNFIEERPDKTAEFTAQEKIALKGQGFVIIDDGPGMKMNFRTKADKAVIYKTGIKSKDSSYNLHTSFLDKLLLDKIFLTISLFFALFSILAGGASLFFDYAGYKESLGNTNLASEQKSKKKKKRKKKKDD